MLESVDHAVKTTDLGDVRLPGPMTTDDFTRAVAVATVSALRHQQQSASHNPMRMRNPENEAIVGGGQKASQGGGQGGHDAPSWSRTTSASVLLGCTALYAIIAGEYPSFHLIILGSLTNGWLLTELLVDVVDIVLKDSEIDEKFLGVTLFALVPNTTEFMNAISFALVKFPLYILLKRFAALCCYWTLCLVVVTTVELNDLLGLCITQTPILILLSSSTASSILNIKKILAGL